LQDVAILPQLDDHTVTTWLVFCKGLFAKADNSLSSVFRGGASKSHKAPCGRLCAAVAFKIRHAKNVMATRRQTGR
jgi:hypothetical protein